MSTPAYFQDEEFQDALVGGLTRSLKMLRQLAPVLGANDFKPLRGMKWGEERWVIAVRALEYYREHKKPIRKLLRATVLKHAADLQYTERQIASLDEYIARIEGLTLAATDALVEIVLAFKKQHLKAATITDLIELQQAGTLTDDKWRETFERGLIAAPPESPMNVAQLLKTPFAELRFTLNNKVPKGTLILAAKPKEKKTWLALAMALAVVRNEKFLGSTVKTPGPVLYYALEDSARRIKERALLLLPRVNGECDETGVDQMEIAHEFPGIDGLEEKLREKARALVIIDPLLAILPPRKTNEIVRADYQEMQPFRKLAQKHDTTIMFVHHGRKAPGDSRDVLIGTTGLTAAVDTIWVMTADKSSDSLKHVNVFGRDVEEKHFNVEFGRIEDPTNPVRLGWRVVAEGTDTLVGGPLQQRILTLLKKEDLSAKQVAMKLGGNYKSVINSVMVTLRKMRSHRPALVTKTGLLYGHPANAR